MFLFTTPARPGPEGDVRQAIRSASERTGVTFDYLLGTAQRESGLDAGAKAKTSSARGLFQFVESTWLATLRDAGAALGYAAYADRIGSDPSGRPVVADAADRHEILKLRDDPEASALMAGALARQNSAAIETRLGRAPAAGELYLAHFLGAGGAVDLIRMAEDSPGREAADAFPAAARANRPIFYAQDGRARTAAEVYARLTRLPAVETGQEGAAPSRASAAFVARPAEGGAFHGLFTDAGRGLGPIAGAVAALWRSEGNEAAGQASGQDGEPARVAAPAGVARAALLQSDGLPLDIRPAGSAAPAGPEPARVERTYR